MATEQYFLVGRVLEPARLLGLYDCRRIGSFAAGSGCILDIGFIGGIYLDRIDRIPDRFPVNAARVDIDVFRIGGTGSIN